VCSGLVSEEERAGISVGKGGRGAAPFIGLEYGRGGGWGKRGDNSIRFLHGDHFGR
jgi:hypothetical protein